MELREVYSKGTIFSGTYDGEHWYLIKTTQIAHSHVFGQYYEIQGTRETEWRSYSGKLRLWKDIRTLFIPAVNAEIEVIIK